MSNKEPKLAIFAALADEIRITRSKIQIDESVTVKPSRIIKGQYAGKPLILVRTGIGVHAMEHAVSYCITNYKPAICINVGYCGATVPSAQTGDFVIADRIVDSETEEEFATTPELVARAKDICLKHDMRHEVAGIATVHEVIRVPHEKAFIGTKLDVRALDMESHAFVKACHDGGAGCVVVRAVLDPMDMRLPRFDGAIDEDGETNILGAIGNMIRRPKNILAIPKIEYCAVQAREAIAAFIDAWLEVSPEG